MNLRDGVYAVRTKIGEMIPNLWSDDEIIEELNVSARRMCSAAQYLQSFSTFSTHEMVMPDGTTQFAQEYVLPIDVDQIIGAAYFAGTLFPLIPCPRESVQLGGKVGGIPWYFYEKKQTKFLTQQTNNGNIQVTPLSPNSNGDAKTVIGLYPVPQSVLPIYIWYLEWHPNLKNAFDEVQIPDRFKQGWIGYAVARMKEKESAIAESQYWDAIHDKYTQEFVDYMIQNGQEICPPIYSNRPIPPYFLRGANTVLVVAQNPGVTNM